MTLLQVTRQQIKDLYNELKNLPEESNAVILNVLQGNDWQPVTVKTIEDTFAEHTVLVDHDYLPGNKKVPVHCFGENQCEPLDTNYLPDLLISHSVAISNLPEQQTETSMIVETDEATIFEETLNDDTDFQSNSNLPYSIPHSVTQMTWISLMRTL